MELDIFYATIGSIGLLGNGFCLFLQKKKNLLTGQRKTFNYLFFIHILTNALYLLVWLVMLILTWSNLLEISNAIKFFSEELFYISILLCLGLNSFDRFMAVVFPTHTKIWKVPTVLAIYGISVMMFIVVTVFMVYFLMELLLGTYNPNHFEIYYKLINISGYVAAYLSSFCILSCVVFYTFTFVYFSCCRGGSSLSCRCQNQVNPTNQNDRNAQRTQQSIDNQRHIVKMAIVLSIVTIIMIENKQFL